MLLKLSMLDRDIEIMCKSPEMAKQEFLEIWNEYWDILVDWDFCPID